MLTDFGIARPQDATSITQTGQMPGTARYMAPELMRGRAGDAGQRPLLVRGRAARVPLRPSPRAEASATLAERLCDPDPDRRPCVRRRRRSRTCSALARGLRTRGPPSPRSRPTLRPRRRRRAAASPPCRHRSPSRRRSPRLAAVAALAALAALVAVVIASRAATIPGGTGRRLGADRQGGAAQQAGTGTPAEGQSGAGGPRELRLGRRRGRRGAGGPDPSTRAPR